MEPTEVKVIVYGARNLQGKKTDRCKASVIFGIGDDKCRTTVVNNSNPDWNEESVFAITGGESALVFTVRDKQDILGEVTLPIETIPHRCLGKRRIEDLQSSKKCPNPSGQLVFDCWVTKSRKATQESQGEESAGTSERTALKGSWSGTLTWVRGTLLGSPLPSKKVPVSNFSRRGSRSVSDIAKLFADDMNPPLLMKTSSHQDIRPRTISEPGSDESVDTRPEISGLSPREGPVEGGTKITIRGRNLGDCKDDVVKLTICGSDCLPSLEHDSPGKIRCTTKEWKVCSGPVLVETRSGGLGISLVKFEFVDGNRLSRKSSPEEEAEEEDGNRGIFSFFFRDKKESDDTKSEQLGDNVDDLQEEIKRLRRRVQDLTEENKNMRRYINNLLTNVMEKCPEVLEQ